MSIAIQCQDGWLLCNVKNELVSFSFIFLLTFQHFQKLVIIAIPSFPFVLLHNYLRRNASQLIRASMYILIIGTFVIDSGSFKSI